MSGWFIKAADYGKLTRAAAAFVATNSICQGRQVDTLWSLIFSAGYEISFAHTSFKWANLASYNAGVTVVIVAISNHASRTRLLFSDADDTGTIVKAVENINAYLVPGPNVIVGQLSSPLSGVHEMTFGNMPNDGGYLLLDVEEAELAVRDTACLRHLFVPSLAHRSSYAGLKDDACGSLMTNTKALAKING